MIKVGIKSLSKANYFVYKQKESDRIEKLRNTIKKRYREKSKDNISVTIEIYHEISNEY